MKVNMLKGKIHRATVVQAELNYVGSITVDKDLLDAAGIYEYEKVHIVDIIILMAYCDLDTEEVKNHKPKVVFVNEENKISRITNYEKHGQLSE